MRSSLYDPKASTIVYYISIERVQQLIDIFIIVVDRNAKANSLYMLALTFRIGPMPVAEGGYLMPKCVVELGVGFINVLRQETNNGGSGVRWRDGCVSQLR